MNKRWEDQEEADSRFVVNSNDLNPKNYNDDSANKVYSVYC